MDTRCAVRNHLLMASCEALLRSGTTCRSAALTDSAFCSHHGTLVAQIGEERVRSGDHPRRRTLIATEPLGADAEPPPVSRNGADPALVRPRLAEAAASAVGEIEAALLDAALGALRPVWVTHTCRDCGQKERIEVQVPDVRSRVAAIQLWLQEGLGRAPQAEEAASPRLPRRIEDLSKLSWDALQMIFASHFADEIAAVTEGDGEALLRERVAALDEGQRQMLREALDEVAVA